MSKLRPVPRFGFFIYICHMLFKRAWRDIKLRRNFLKAFVARKNQRNHLALAGGQLMLLAEYGDSTAKEKQAIPTMSAASSVQSPFFSAFEKRCSKGKSVTAVKK